MVINSVAVAAQDLAAGSGSPVLLLHGLRDPRTEPGEIEAAHAAFRDARIAWVDSGHAPPASPRASAEATRIAAEFLRVLPP